MSSVVKSSESYRTFIAIELPREIRERIRLHIDQLRTAFPDVRASWSRDDNLHLTLKFLGEVPVDRIPALSDAVAKAASTAKPFELIVDGCGTFPPHGKPKVLWIGSGGILPACGTYASSVHRSPETATGIAGATSEPFRSQESPGINAQHPNPAASPLILLHSAIEENCATAGFEREARAYHPHLTIARLREAKGTRALAERHEQIGFTAQRFIVSEVIVFRSELSSKGSKHTALSRHRVQ